MFDDGNESLDFGTMVSEALVSIVRDLEVKPAYILAKGGITSSDIAVKALNISRGMVVGQIIPGVPVWKSGEGSKWPEIPYIIFPGNVGEDSAISDVIDILK